ncbi:hypothetical protein KBD71_05770 [Candidatus Woesebacteria bacterium]|nr:hypothetical protein [Candidatus Woesebacteria bacterium]
MPLTTEQAEFLNNNYHKTFKAHNKRAQAAIEASQRLAEIDTARFTNIAAANWHGELAIQAATFWNSAAKKAPTLSEALSAIEHSARLQIEHFPVATTIQETRLRKAYFAEVFNGQDDPYIRMFREFRNLVSMLIMLGTAEGSEGSLLVLNEHLENIQSLLPSEGGTFILQIERGNFLQASKALIDFVSDYIARKKNNPTEFKAVIKKYLQRFKGVLLREKAGNVYAHLSSLATSGVEAKTISPSLLEELLKLEYIGFREDVVGFSSKRF